MVVCWQPEDNRYLIFQEYWSISAFQSVLSVGPLFSLQSGYPQHGKNASTKAYGQVHFEDGFDE